MKQRHGINIVASNNSWGGVSSFSQALQDAVVRAAKQDILFVAAGAFHISKPSDLIPELQGRFPIRVELDALGRDDFVRILTEPKNALISQYIALMATEGLTLVFTDEAIGRVAELAAVVNDRMENIGARRLHTMMERLLDEVSFHASELPGQSITIDVAYVDRMLADIVKSDDLSRYIL